MKLVVGVIGLGYWGPNFLRNFNRHEQVQVAWGCDVSDKQLNEMSVLYPQTQFTRDYKDILTDKLVDLVAIATPPETHYEIIKACLLAEKHTFVAKPMTINSISSFELSKIAKKQKLMLHGDLTFLYADTVRKIKNLIKNKDIGEPFYYDSTRTNLGLIQNEANVIWDLAIHDLAIIDYCFDFIPKKIFAVASKHLKNSRSYEMAHISLTYSNSFIAHIHVSWLSPVKIRNILIGGSKKMIYFDDVVPDEKIKIYDRGVDIPPAKITPFKPAYRRGDILIPKIDNEEAVFVEIKEIVNQILNNKINYANTELNIKLLKILEACDRSIKTNKPIEIQLSKI